MKRQIPTVVLVLLLLVGVSLLLYPTLSDRYNTARQTKAIAKHTEAVENLDDEEIDRLWEEAEEYNKTLLNNDDRFTLSAQEQKEYEKLLDVNGDGIMTYIDIPKLNLTLPVYHGSEEKELQVAIGHIPGSSLPVGGVGTHCVLSGHRGLPSAKLFSDINTLQEGDYFHLITLGQVLTYEVDQIRVVLPEEVNDIEIDPEQDYCTLVTCTPYGINTHRLLVRGHRVDAADVDLQGVADALLVDTTEVAAVVGIPILVVIVLWLQFHSKKETNRKHRKR
jgi:sortase A